MVLDSIKPLGVLSALVVFVLSCYSQLPNCASLEPIPASPMQYKDRGNRCEGFYVADVGAPSIDVVALTFGSLKYDLNKDAKLFLFTPPGVGHVHVRAMALPLRTYYRMDAELDPGKVLEWPIGDVLRPSNLTSDRIGIMAWRSIGDEKVLIPLFSSSSVSSSATSSLPVNLIIRPSFDVEAIKWRAGPFVNGSCAQLGVWKDAPRTEALAGQPVGIKLAGLAGQICVEIAARAKNREDWATLPLKLQLPPQ